MQIPPIQLNSSKIETFSI